MMARYRLVLFALGLSVVLTSSVLAQKKGGTITGVVTFAGTVIPKNDPANVDKDKAHCLAKGAILKNELVVDPKTKGVANVMVWLVDAKDPNKKIPFTGKVNPIVEIDQPCCEFIPRIVFIAPGQKLKVLNSSPISHNISILGGAAGPNINPLLPAKGSYTHPDEITPRLFPIPFSCSIHGWMKGFLFAVPSPYAEVTTLDAKGKTPGGFKIENVPPGEYKLMAWHEKAGFLLLGPGGIRDRGKKIVVTAGGTVKVDIPLKIAE